MRRIRLPRRSARWCGALVLALLGLAGCAETAGVARPAGEYFAFFGTVQHHDPGVAIGGETDPAGYVLVGDHSYDRLYLSVDDRLDHPRLEAYLERRVRVRGPLGRVRAGGVETPERDFPVLEIETIAEVPSAAVPATEED
jgi:hypothetical protein